MHKPKWSLFYDFHTMPACSDVGKNFNAEDVTDRIKKCGVDFVVFHARCNMGMAYYNTKIGIRHPSLKFDLFGELAKACQKKDIALSAYFNVGLSHEEALLHREWCVMGTDGHLLISSLFRYYQLCYNTGYSDHLLKMIKEVVTGYPISGLFLDCFHTQPCVGVECIREMKAKGVDWTNEKELHDFNYAKMLKMAKRISDFVKKLNPDLLIYFNGIDYEAQKDFGTYLEFECLPTVSSTGYELLPVGARYLRTLKKPVLNMTVRFHKQWGDFGGIRTEPSLEYDCLYGIANGIRPTIGGHFHPRGDINEAVFDLYEKVYTKLQKFEPRIDNAEAITEIAVINLMPTVHRYLSTAEKKLYKRNHYALKGATRMLCELNAQFDIVSHFASWEEYQLLILPDFVLFDDETAKRIKKHLDKGGFILSSGWSGLDHEEGNFVFDEWGLNFLEEDPFDPAYMQVEKKLNKNMPNMPVCLYERGAAVEAKKGTEVLAKIVSPYYNHQWDGEHSYAYVPPDKLTDRPVVTCYRQVAHISNPIFSSYYNDAPLPLRQLVSNLLEKLVPDPMIKISNFPSFGRVTVTKQKNRRMCHILSYLPEHRGEKRNMIEEPIELRDVSLSLRVDNRSPKRVYLAPTKQKLRFEVIDGYIKTIVPVMKGYAMVVFEDQ